MKDLPYHHLSDGSFRNPEGSPVRDSSFNWSFKIFNEKKKKRLVCGFKISGVVFCHCGASFTILWFAVCLREKAREKRADL